MAGARVRGLCLVGGVGRGPRLRHGVGPAFFLVHAGVLRGLLRLPRVPALHRPAAAPDLQPDRGHPAARRGQALHGVGEPVQPCGALHHRRARAAKAEVSGVVAGRHVARGRGVPLPHVRAGVPTRRALPGGSVLRVLLVRAGGSVRCDVW